MSDFQPSPPRLSLCGETQHKHKIVQTKTKNLIDIETDIINLNLGPE